MVRIVVLLTLKPGTDRAKYEAWAATQDVPTVNALSSVDTFSVHRATGLLGGGDAPYDYIEILDVADMDRFGEETQTEVMRGIAAQFREWADPVFIVTEPVEENA